jgi:uncharacterized membrane protein YdjX (TVP38/TMEM64 family)
MKKILLPIAFILIVALAFHAAWPFLQPHLKEVARALIHFKTYCHQNPYAGYAIYVMITLAILPFGLPISTAVMLLAGIIFSFWEATTLIMACRFAAAMLTLLAVRHVWGETDGETRAGDKGRTAKKRLPRMIRNHPNWSVLLVRLAPIPDSVVNYSLAAAPVREDRYALMSLIGMVPFTLLCVWIGQHLGTVNNLLSYIK